MCGAQVQDTSYFFFSLGNSAAQNYWWSDRFPLRQATLPARRHATVEHMSYTTNSGQAHTSKRLYFFVTVNANRQIKRLCNFTYALIAEESGYLWFMSQSHRFFVVVGLTKSQGALNETKYSQK